VRYYNILITGAPDPPFPARYENGAQWGTITPDGQHDPNAQQVEFQIIEYVLGVADSENSVLTIHGVSWDQIKACNQLVGKPIRILGGMSPGLPLATFQSQRPKLLMEGTIQKCWGNWIGTETSIGMAFLPSGIFKETQAAAQEGGGSTPTAVGTTPTQGGGGSTQSIQTTKVNRVGLRSLDRRQLPVGPSARDGFDIGSISGFIGGIASEFGMGPAVSQFGNVINSFFGGGNISPLGAPLNLIHNLLPNMPLSGAIQETLSKVFPNANLNIAISSGLKLAYQDAGMYQSLEQYIGYLNKLSQSIMGITNYFGIHLSSHDNTINVWDRGTGVGDISYLELIGQPTWLDIVTISVKVVLRGGLYVGNLLTIPATLVGFNGADSVLAMDSGQTDQRTHISLPGSYLIVKVLHIGDFRNPDGAAWSTNYEAVTQTSAGAAAQAASIAPPGNVQPL
jgi:hypothetical protein